MVHKLFVYGTLKPQYNLDKPIEATTEPCFTLYNYGRFPAAVHGGNTPIKGVILEVTEHKLQELDEYEGHPVFFKRTPVNTSKGPAEMYVYQNPAFLEKHNAEIIESGFWCPKSHHFGGLESQYR